MFPGGLHVWGEVNDVINPFFQTETPLGLTVDLGSSPSWRIIAAPVPK